MFNTILYIKLMNVYSHLNKWYKGLEIFKTLCNFYLKKVKTKNLYFNMHNIHIF